MHGESVKFHFFVLCSKFHVDRMHFAEVARTIQKGEETCSRVFVKTGQLLRAGYAINKHQEQVS